MRVLKGVKYKERWLLVFTGFIEAKAHFWIQASLVVIHSARIFCCFFLMPSEKKQKKTAPNQDLLQTILAKPKHPLKQSHVALCPCSEKGFVAICNKNWLPLTFGSYKAILRHFKNHLLMIALNFVFLLLPLPAMFKKGFCIYERGFLC